MPRTPLPISNGYYEDDSLPISAQNAVNVFPVIEEAPALDQETLRGCPGCSLVANVSGGGLCLPYGCDAFETYLTELLGESIALNTATDATTALSFPIDTGQYNMDTDSFESFGSLVNPDVDVGDPCVEGAWARVLRTDTYAELLPPDTLHLVGTEAVQGLSVAVILKNNPTDPNPPVTGITTNIFDVLYAPNWGGTLNFLLSDDSTSTENPTGPGVTSHIGLRRNGTSVEIIYKGNGTETIPPPVASWSTTTNVVLETFTMPEAAWEDWLVISITLDPQFINRITELGNQIYCEHNSGDWAVQIAYNKNAGTALPREVEVRRFDKTTSGSFVRYFGSYFRTVSGDRTREITGVTKTGPLWSLLDNTDSYVAGVYTDSATIDAELLYGNFLRNYADYVLPDFC